MSGDGDVLWLRRDVTIENDRAWQGRARMRAADCGLG